MPGVLTSKKKMLIFSILQDCCTDLRNFLDNKINSGRNRQFYSSVNQKILWHTKFGLATCSSFISFIILTSQNGLAGQRTPAIWELTVTEDLGLKNESKLSSRADLVRSLFQTTTCDCFPLRLIILCL